MSADKALIRAGAGARPVGGAIMSSEQVIAATIRGVIHEWLEDATREMTQATDCVVNAVSAGQLVEAQLQLAAVVRAQQKLARLLSVYATWNTSVGMDA